jgi:hypothetical protein
MRYVILLATVLAMAAAPRPAHADMIKTTMTVKDKEVRAVMQVPPGVVQRVVIENNGPGSLVIPEGPVTLKAGESLLTSYRSGGAAPFSIQGLSGPNQISIANIYYLF